MKIHLVDGTYELFSVPLAGGTAHLISHDRKIDSYLDIGNYRISADSQWVVFFARDEIYPNGDELCSVPMDGSALYILTGVVERPGEYETWRINPNSQTVEFLSDYVDTEVMNLIQAPITRDYYQWWNQLNGWLVEEGDVTSFTYHPGGNYVVYKADQEVDEKYELFVTFDGIFLPMVRR